MFPQVNKLITMKKTVSERPTSSAILCQITPATKPVPTRWGTWIEAGNFYNEHFETAKSIVAQFPSESALSMCEPQSAFRDPKVAYSVVYIRSNFGWLPESIKRLETQGFALQESMNIMKNASEKLSVMKGESGESVSTKFQVVLKRNPGFSTFTIVCQVLNGDNVDLPEDIAAEKIPLFKYAPVTSCFV
jgi:hypothetical protein